MVVHTCGVVSGEPERRSVTICVCVCCGASWLVRVQAVAAVGVDLNVAATRVHVGPMLQFVPGLGPRKATKLVQVRRMCRACGG